jgi:DNA mismatch endonuclease (patch repair protein)
MVSNRGKNTKLEIDLRSALHRTGMRFWKHRRPLDGVRCEADIIFPRIRMAVFVNGCFWHGCPQHATWPVTNAEFWTRKIEGTKQRDRRCDQLLEAAGWTVVRLWEHQPLEEMVSLVLRTASSLGTGNSASVIATVAPHHGPSRAT